MAEKKTMTNEERRRIVVEKMWLNFYNNHFLEKGLITPEQHRTMQIQIAKRYTNAKY